MCRFFSFVTEPEEHGGKRFYFDWEYRKTHLTDNDADSHDHIINYYRLGDDKCNTYEYNPLTKTFTVDKINNNIDDRIQALAWVEQLDWKRIIEPLIIKPIVYPFTLPKAEATEKTISLLKQAVSVWNSAGNSVGTSMWAFVGDSVLVSVWNSVWDSVGHSVRASVGNSIWSSAEDSVWDSVGNSARAYMTSFLDIEYEYDFSPAIKLWERGLVASYDGKIWRLHSGNDAEVVYKIAAADL